jgi:hypothetical protein
MKRQLSTISRAAPVRQSDHGANVKSETATTLIITVASTMPRRPRSSETSYAFTVSPSQAVMAAIRVSCCKIILALDVGCHAST